MLRPIDQFIVDGFRDDPQSMAVVEQLVQNYFDKYMAPEIDRARAEVYRKQADFLKQPTGFLNSMADASHPAHFDDRLSRETLIGSNKDLFKNPEDMVLFCKRQLRANLEMGRDMTLMTQAWRHSALIQIGQEEYDKICATLHEDLAVLYMDYRLSEMILKKMVDEQAPKSSVEYVFRKACEGSLFGVAQSLKKTPLQRRIDDEADARLAPSVAANNAAKVLSFALDAPMGGALTSLGSLIGLGAFEIGLNMAQPIIISHLQGGTKEKTIEEILSERMFNSQKDVFAKMRTQKLDYITETNVINTLMPRMNYSPDLFSHTGRAAVDSGKTSGKGAKKGDADERSDSVFTQSPFDSVSADKGEENDSVFAINKPAKSSSKTKPESNPTTKPTSSTLAPKKDSKPTSAAEECEKDKTRTKSDADKNTSEPSKSTSTDGGDQSSEIEVSTTHDIPSLSSKTTTPSTSVAEENPSTTQNNASEDEDREMASQWAPLIGQFGLSDIKHVGANLGLILATLPDMLFGMFGKHENATEFSWGKNLVPIASLLLGFKLNNPILKMLLVGFGGVGLIKNSMDNIDSKDLSNQTLQSPSGQQVQFVPYTEQPLNPRIQNLKINNNIMVMDIDRVPYSVTLPDAVVMAYKSKSLPLSTLANAVLQKYDEAVAAMAQNANNDLNQSIHSYNPGMDLSGSEHEAVTLK